MNIYFIEDNEDKHVLFRSVLACCNEMANGQLFNDGFGGHGRSAWCDSSKLVAALQDDTGIFLLDLHMPCETAGAITDSLIANFAGSLPDIRREYETLLNEKFPKESSAYQIGMCLVALIRAKKLRVIITSTDPEKIDGDKTARELTRDHVQTIPTSGFPAPLNPDEASLPNKVAAHQYRIRALASTILKEAMRNEYDKADFAWAEVCQELNNGAWPNHPTRGAKRLFAVHPWHTAKDWLKALKETPANQDAIKTAQEAQAIVNRFLGGLHPNGGQIAAMDDALIVLRAAFQGTTTTQFISTILLFHVFKDNLTLPLPKFDRFTCIAIPIQENDAAKLGRFIQGLWALCVSTDNVTHSKFSATVDCSDASAVVTLWAEKSDAAQATAAAECIDGKGFRMGTAARAFEVLRKFSNATVQCIESRVEISMSFTLTTIN